MRWQINKHETSKPQISAARLSWLMHVRTHPRHPPPLRGRLLRLRLPGAELRHWHVVAGGPDGTGLDGCGRQQGGLGGGGRRGHGLCRLGGGVCLALRHGLLCFILRGVSCGKGIQTNRRYLNSNVGSYLPVTANCPLRVLAVCCHAWWPACSVCLFSSGCLSLRVPFDGPWTEQLLLCIILCVSSRSLCLRARA